MGAHSRLGDEECSNRPIDIRTATPCGRAVKWLRSCGSNVVRRRACTQRAERGSDPFLNVLIELLAQRAVSVSRGLILLRYIRVDCIP